MARIRSIHPGLFTDERYMAISIPARELLKGLWCEADDQGVFQWKPYTIKARIFPADAISVDGLLGELSEHNFIRPFEVDGRKYGAIRNFRKFQRPKKPNAIHPLPEELRTYVFITSIEQNQTDKTDPVPHQSGTGGEESPQRKDGGGRREDVKTENPPAEVVDLASRARRASSYAFEGKVIRLAHDDFEKWRTTFTAIPDLLAELYTIDVWLHERGLTENWFHRTSAMLSRKHQEWLAEQAKAKAWVERSIDERYPNEGVFRKAK